MGTSRDPWAAVTRRAESDHGLVDAAYLSDRLGIGPGHTLLERWRREGMLVRVAPRVWRVQGAPITWRQRLRAGLLSLGPGALVSHEAAAQLHGFDRTPPDRVEFLVPRAQRNARLAATLHSSTSIVALDRVRIDGLDVTSATRTVLDLASVRVAPVRLAAAIDSATASGASAPVVIQRRLADLRGRGRWGSPAVDAALVHAGGHTMLERLFLELVAEAGLPRPETQVVFRDGSRHLARVDFCFPDHAVVVEVSGRVGHSSRADRAKDAQRRNELQAIGMQVYEFTWDDVTRRPAYVRATMHRVLAGNDPASGTSAT